MAEHTSSDNSGGERVPDLEEKDALITDEPYIHFQRRRAMKQAEEAREFNKKNPEFKNLLKKVRRQKSDS